MIGPSRVHVSGGGHRATFGAMGAVWAMLDTGTWGGVESVVTVSGGSVAGGILIGADTDDETAARLAHGFDRALAQAGPLWRSPRRLALVVVPLVAAVVWVAGLVIAMTRGGGGVVVAVVLAVFGPPLLITIGRNAFAAYVRTCVAAIVGHERRLDSFSSSPRQYVFCATGLSSGAPYYLWGGRSSLLGDDAVRWGTGLQQELTVVDAVCASTALPGLGRQWVRPTSPNDGVLAGGEYLVDGGVSGTLGHQLLDRADHPPGGATRSAVDVLVLDASRHPRPSAPIVRHLGRVSMISSLVAWLATSFEATKVNDLLDVPRSRLVRLAETHLDPGPEVDLTALPAAIRQRIAGGDGPDDEVERRLAGLRAKANTVGLLGLDRSSALLLVTLGYVATLAAIAPTEIRAERLDEHLRQLGDRLGDPAAAARVWDSAQSSTS